MAFYFVRHGETVWNVQHRLQGVHDIPLDEKGIRQAEELHRQLIAEGVHFVRVYSSPLSRALRTAEIVSGQPASEIFCDDRLREMEFGSMEGDVYAEDAAGGRGCLPEAQTSGKTGAPQRQRETPPGSDQERSAASQDLPEIATAMEDFLGKPSRYQPPEGGETFQQVCARAHSFLADLAAREKDAAGDILIVSHGGIMHGLLFVLNHRTDIDAFWHTRTPNCQPIRFEQIVL